MFCPICSPALCVFVFIQPVPWSPPSASGVQELLTPFSLDIYLPISLLSQISCLLCCAQVLYLTLPAGFTGSKNSFSYKAADRQGVGHLQV